jgi:hypothetical protein
MTDKEARYLRKGDLVRANKTSGRNNSDYIKGQIYPVIGIVKSRYAFESRIRTNNHGLIHGWGCKYFDIVPNTKLARLLYE